MEEILEELRLRCEDVPTPLILPSEDDLVDVEEELLLSIPRDLRLYLLTASDVVYGHLEPVTASDSSSHTYLPEVASFAWSYGLPRHLLPICELAKGYYCIDPDGVVQLWENGEFAEQQWDNLWLWIEDVWLKNN